jgi:hypothetical protein
VFTADEVPLDEDLFFDFTQRAVVLAVAVFHLGQCIDDGADFFEKSHPLHFRAETGKRVSAQVSRESDAAGHDDLRVWAAALHPIGRVFDQSVKSHHDGVVADDRSDIKKEYALKQRRAAIPKKRFGPSG